MNSTFFCLIDCVMCRLRIPLQFRQQFVRFGMCLARLWLEYVVFLFFIEHILSIMSGDSPNTHQTDIFDFKEGRTSPAPTTSKDAAVQSGGEVVHATVLVEPEKDKDKDKEDESKDLNSPILNNASQDERRSSDPDQTVQLEELKFSGKDKDRREKRKLNGDLDRLDGVWVPSRDPRKDVKAEEDDQNCTVKCLYYTMQCCECAII